MKSFKQGCETELYKDDYDGIVENRMTMKKLETVK